MNLMSPWIQRAGLACTAIAASAQVAPSAQDRPGAGGVGPPQPVETRPIEVAPVEVAPLEIGPVEAAPLTSESGEAAGPRDELLELFAQVERRLEEIDGMLYDAGAGERGLSSDMESGIGKLLQESLARVECVVKDMDRILEIAREQGGACSSALNGESSSSSTSSKPSPLDSGQSSAPRERESTPERPEGQGPDPRAPKPSPKPNSEKTGQPRSPGEAPAEEPKSKPASDVPPQGELGGPAERGSDNERWGELPIHLREIFRAEGGGDLPPQYREWIESYWRRLNQTRKP